MSLVIQLVGKRWQSVGFLLLEVNSMNSPRRVLLSIQRRYSRKSPDSRNLVPFSQKWTVLLLPRNNKSQSISLVITFLQSFLRSLFHRIRRQSLPIHKCFLLLLNLSTLTCNRSFHTLNCFHRILSVLNNLIQRRNENVLIGALSTNLSSTNSLSKLQW